MTILRNTDGAENAGPQEVDPFARAASGIEPPKYPVLAADRLVDMEIVKATIDTVKEDVSKPPGEQRTMLTLALKTTKDYADKDGKPLRAGFSGFKRIGLFEVKGDPKKRDRTYEANIIPELAECLRCVGMGNRSPRELLTNPSMIERAIVKVKTSIQPERDGYPESNGFKFVPPA